MIYYHPPYPNQWDSEGSDDTPVPSVTFIVNPELHDSMEFIDMLIQSNEIPGQITIDTVEPTASPYLITSPTMRDFNPGWYKNVGKRNQGADSGKPMQGPYLYVKIEFDETVDVEHILRAARFGYRKIIG